MGITLQQELLQTGRKLMEETRTFEVEGRLELPPGAPPVERVCACRARVRDLRARTEPGRVLLEGLIDTELVYQAPAADAELRLQPEHLALWTKENGGAIPWAQEIPYPGIEAGAQVEAVAAAAGASLDPLEAGSYRCRVSLTAAVQDLTQVEGKVVTEAITQPPGGLEVAKEILRPISVLGKAEVEAPVATVLILPEIKPDLVRLVAREPRLADLTAEVARGRIIVEGRLRVETVYVSRGEDGGEGLETAEWGGEGRTPIAFEAFLDLPGLPPEAVIEPRGALGRFNLEVIGPRELRLEAGVHVTVQAVGYRQVPVVTEIVPGAEEVADLRRIEIDCTTLAGRAAQDLSIETTLELPPGKPDLHRIMQAWAAVPELTAQAGEGKCLVDGWLDLVLLYQADSDGQPALAAADWSRRFGTGISIAEVVELPEAVPGLDASISWHLARVDVEQVTPRIVRVAAVVPVEIKATEKRTVSAVVDAALVPVSPVAGRPSMLFYIIQPHDNLWDIARRYQTTVEAIMRVNKIAESQAVVAGRKLLIPRSPLAV